MALNPGLSWNNRRPDASVLILLFRLIFVLYTIPTHSSTVPSPFLALCCPTAKSAGFADMRGIWFCFLLGMTALTRCSQHVTFHNRKGRHLQFDSHRLPPLACKLSGTPMEFCPTLAATSERPLTTDSWCSVRYVRLKTKALKMNLNVAWGSCRAARNEVTHGKANLVRLYSVTNSYRHVLRKHSAEASSSMSSF